MFIHVAVRGGEVRAVGALSREQSRFSKSAYAARWSWNGSVLEAAVDRYGFARMFYAQIGDGVAVADTVEELLQAGASRAYDDAAIATFLRLGFFIGQDTAFAAIRAFPIGGELTWTLYAGLKVAENIPFIPIDHSIERKEALERYVSLFSEAIRRSLPADASRTAVPLSGGRDSRHIAFELHRHGFKPGLVISQRHFSTVSNEDSRVAGLVANALGWTLTLSDQMADPFAAETRKNSLLEGTTREHAWYLPTAERIASGGFTHVFDGIAGDVLSNGLFCRASWLKQYAAGDVPGLFKSMSAAGCAEEAISVTLSADLNKRWNKDVAFHRFQRELDRFAGEDDPISRFMFWNRTRRCIAPLAQCVLTGVEIITPYLDDEVFRHLFSLPRRFFETRDFHDEAIHLAAPQFAQIPFERKDVGGDDPPRHDMLMFRGIAGSTWYWRSPLFNQSWLRPRLLAALFSTNAAKRASWVASAVTAVSGIAQSSSRS